LVDEEAVIGRGRKHSKVERQGGGEKKLRFLWDLGRSASEKVPVSEILSLKSRKKRNHTEKRLHILHNTTENGRNWPAKVSETPVA